MKLKSSYPAVMQRGLAAAAFFFPLLARAEVMDKELSVPTLAAITAALALGGFWSAYRASFALGLLVLCLALVFFGAHLSEVLDPHVGPAIVKEAGLTYIAVSWGAPLLVAVGALFGWRLGRSNVKRGASRADDAG